MTSSHHTAQPAQTSSTREDFDALFEQHWDRICQTLFRLLGDWDEAQDLAIETFVQLYAHPPASGSNPSGWLYRVATNLGFNALRSRSRRRRYEEKAGQEAWSNATAADPAEDVEGKAEQQRARAALQSIRPRSARILLLRYSGLSYAEIAAAMNIAPGSVGTLLARAENEFEKAFNR